MSDPQPLKLVALASKIDSPFIPPLQQVIIFISNLGLICELEPHRLPKDAFELSACSSPNPEESDKAIGIKGIDGLGRYDSEEISVTLDFCLVASLCATHGFNREDVVKIVLIHELAHFVTHLGTNSGVHWDAFSEEKSDKKEDVAQESTHLLLRVAGYGHLVHVFNALSNLCPPRYNTWRKTWANQLKSEESIDAILKHFPGRVLELRKPPPDRTDSIDLEHY